MRVAGTLSYDWPTFGLTDDIRPALSAALRSGQACALATLYAASGGAPRGIGAQMLVTGETVSGYLSGGCIEADVFRHALRALEDGQPRRLIYGQGGPVDIRLPCGGRVDLLVERIDPQDPAAHRLIDHAEKRRPALWLSDGTVRACVPDRVPQDGSPELPGGAALLAGLISRHPGLSSGQPVVFRRYVPRFRLVVVGGDPTALALAMMAQQVGMEVHVVRPKGPAVPPPVPGIAYRRSAPSVALGEIGPDPWTAVAVATHQDDEDLDALVASLPTPAAYVGLLGSMRRLPAQKARLAGAGLPPEHIARLKAPIGLPLGGKSPWEIATGIIAEIYQTVHADAAERRTDASSIAAA